MKQTFVILFASMVASQSGAQAIPSGSQAMDQVLRAIDAKRDLYAGVANQIWSLAEVGYQEEKSSALLQAQLRSAGFAVRSGVADIPTAFVASYGTAGPVIGVLAEFDALPGITQAAVATRLPIEDKAAAHACGHNLFAAGSLGAAIAIKNWLAESGTTGSVRVYGTPAEEGGSGKVYMVRAGLFDDVDIVLHWHASDKNSAAAQTTLANRSAQFRFRGVSAHASNAPEKARSALDGVEALNYMTNLMREHVPQETRIHYVVTSGGRAPNVVPDFAEVFYYVRHPDATILEEIWARVEEAARGAALGTGTQVEWEIIHGNHPLLVNETLAKTMDEKLRRVGGIAYTAQEREFAESIYATLDAPAFELGSEESVQPFEVSLSYGSTDVGDVSIAVPTVGLNTATWVPGTAAHSWQAVAASGMSIGFKGAHNAAKTLTLTAIELYRDADLRAAAAAEHRRKVGEAFRYEALLGDRPAARLSRLSRCGPLGRRRIAVGEHRLKLGEHRECDPFGRARADVETDGSAQSPRQVARGGAQRHQQPFFAVPWSEHAHVTQRGRRQLPQIRLVGREVMAHDERGIERGQIDLLGKRSRIDLAHIVGAPEVPAREISRPMVADGRLPTELGGHIDDRHRIETGAEHQDARHARQRSIQNAHAVRGRLERGSSRRKRLHAALGHIRARRDSAEDLRFAIRGADDRRAGHDRVDGGFDDGCACRLRARQRQRAQRRERLVSVGGRQALQQHANQSIAADTEPEYVVGAVAKIVRHGQSEAARDHAARALGEIALEAAAADQTLVIAVVGDHDAVPCFAIRRAERLVDRCEHERSSRRLPFVERLDDSAHAHNGRQA